MDLLHGLEGLRSLPRGATLSIGNFDGIHRGHQRLMRVARELAGPGAAFAVATFEPHPLTVLRPGQAAPRLTSPALKRALLHAEGANALVELAPTPEVLDLTAEQFWQVLRDDVRPRYLVEGSSFYFGKGRGGSIARLTEWTAGTEVQLHVVSPLSVPLLNLCLVPVSSSVVRWLLTNGRARDAAICLGRPYRIVGDVVSGHRRGRTIGVPTANLRVDNQLIPADGVYAGRCTLDGRSFAAAVSIGTNPTFSDNARAVEAHLIGFDGDLYGTTLGVDLLDWVRDQWKYASIETLKAQIDRDIVETLARKNEDPARMIGAM